MKKIFGLLLILVAALVFAGCKQDEKEEVIVNTFYDAGLNHVDVIYKDFYHAPGSFAEYNPADPTPGSKYSGSAALWSYGAVMTMLAQAAKINPKNTKIKNHVDDIVLGLEEFRMPRLTMHYSAINGAGGEPYYDDNAWVVLGLYDLAKAYGNEDYMKHSRELLKYVLSGESEDGGVYWKETVTSRNTCSSGPAVVAAVLHYLENPEQEKDLLDAAIRIYDWTKRVLRDPSDKVYWDNATYDYENDKENIVTWKFTYNSGTMIWAGKLLYEATGDETYLQDAEETAAGALGHFFKMVGSSGFYPRTPWFNVYLLRGFIEFGKAFEDGSKDYYVNSFVTNLRYALNNNAAYENGVLLPTWGSGLNEAGDQFTSLLNTAGTAEVLFLLADWQINKEKDTK